SFPTGVAVDSGGNAYVADLFNHTIRKLTPAGVVTTFAGVAESSGSTDGTGSAARFLAPAGLAIDSAGSLSVADAGNHTIRRITPAGVVSTLAGAAGLPGAADGTGSAARFRTPRAVTVDAAGNIYVADTSNQTIRKVTPAGVVTTFAGSAGSDGSVDGTGSGARFRGPDGIAVGLGGNIYVADTSNHTIRRIAPVGVVSTLAGVAGSPGSGDGTGSGARFSLPTGVAPDSAGNVYVTDGGNSVIRRITPAAAVSTVAGLAASTGSVDGIGAAARFYLPSAL